MPVAVSTVQVMKAVTRSVDDYRNTPNAFISDYVAPRVRVNKKSGYLPRFGRKNQKNTDGKVTPWTPSPEIDYDLSTTAFLCEVYRKVGTLPDELKAFDDTSMLDMVTLGLQVAESMEIERELEVATLLTDTTNSVTSQSAPTTRWDATGGNPAKDVATAIGTVDDNINRIPEYGLCPRKVGLFLRRFVASLRYGGGSAAMASLEEVAAYLGLKELRMMRAGYDSAAPGDTSVGAKTAPTTNGFWVFHKPANPSAMTPQWMSTPWIPEMSNSKVWTIEDPDAAKVRVRDCRDLVVVDKGACVYIATPLT